MTYRKTTRNRTYRLRPSQGGTLWPHVVGPDDPTMIDAMRSFDASDFVDLPYLRETLAPSGTRREVFDLVDAAFLDALDGLSVVVVVGEHEVRNAWEALDTFAALHRQAVRVRGRLSTKRGGLVRLLRSTFDPCAVAGMVLDDWSMTDAAELEMSDEQRASLRRRVRGPFS